MVEVRKAKGDTLEFHKVEHDFDDDGEEDDFDVDSGEEEDGQKLTDDEDDGTREHSEWNNDEMEQLEKEYRHLHHQELDTLKNLKHHKDEDLLKGQALKSQKIWALEHITVYPLSAINSNGFPRYLKWDGVDIDLDSIKHCFHNDLVRQNLTITEAKSRIDVVQGAFPPEPTSTPNHSNRERAFNIEDLENIIKELKSYKVDSDNKIKELEFDKVVSNNKIKELEDRVQRLEEFCKQRVH